MLLSEDYEIVDLNSAFRIRDPAQQVFEIKVAAEDMDAFIKMIMMKFGKK